MVRSPARFTWLTSTGAPATVVLIRLYVGLIFLSEGILKFLRPDQLGSGRFDKAGIPAPGFFAPLDGVFEIVCGLLILVGLVTRLAAVPMIVNMVGALLITKLPILWGDAPLFEGESGWWDFAHEARTGLAQLCGSLFLLLVGAGAYSLDARLHSMSPSAAAASGAEAAGMLPERRPRQV
ncbi:DoxX family protein [Streptomyces regalis]|uniref:DoxX family protein n=1 Tax=Streptomyces regalis TaxID=68262 RepID=A0A101J6H8_9ACTN|nr:DoxX family protein [Streptomyces regalis]KUL21110.1 DoxX family protein [Streptomyces regalis]